MLKGLELFKTLQNGDKVTYRGKIYTVQSTQHDYDFTVKPAKSFVYAAELVGNSPYYYLKNLPDDPTLPIIRALEPVVETPPTFDPLIGMAFGL